MPEVSIVIPTIGREFFKYSYISAINQKVDDMEIIVCDYGNNNIVQEILSIKPDKRVKYFKFEDPGRLEGYRKALELANGKYIKLLLDDDVLLPNSIAIMKKYLDELPNVKLVTSIRFEIDENNKVVNLWGIIKEDKLLDGIKAGDLMLSFIVNYIGEPSTVLFRNEDLYEPYGRFSGIDALCNDDVATWLSLLLKGDLLYLAKPLSLFRVHINQTQKKKGYGAKGLIDWLNHIFTGRKKGYLRDFKIYLQSLKKIVNFNSLDKFLNEAHEKDKIKLVQLLDIAIEEINRHERNRKIIKEGFN